MGSRIHRLECKIAFERVASMQSSKEEIGQRMLFEALSHGDGVAARGHVASDANVAQLWDFVDREDDKLARSLPEWIAACGIDGIQKDSSGNTLAGNCWESGRSALAKAMQAKFGVEPSDVIQALKAYEVDEQAVVDMVGQGERARAICSWKGRGGSTALMWASSRCSGEVVARLAKHSDAGAQDDLGRTALSRSTVNLFMPGPLLALLALPDASDWINRSDHDGMSALMVACRGVVSKDGDCWVEMEKVQALLAAGADAELVDGEGRTALHWAAIGGNVKICELLSSNMSMRTKQSEDGSGKTAWDIAACSGEEGLARWGASMKEHWILTRESAPAQAASGPKARI